MDPLSITASVIIVTGLAGAVVTGLRKLIDLGDAPNKVLSGIRELDSETVSLLARQQLAQHLEDTSGALLDLEKIIHYRLLAIDPAPSDGKWKVKNFVDGCRTDPELQSSKRNFGWPGKRFS
ncbi:MAG: hypothetical protein Q9187_001425 [Circinaria calcarea]